MKALWALAAAVAVLAVLAGAAAAQAFFAEVEDLPLMPGLSELAEETLVFENAQGRIVRVAASGIAPASAIRRFYRQALPALGWTRRGEGRYVRDGESLRITVDAAAGGTVVRFSLSPASE